MIWIVCAVVSTILDVSVDLSLPLLAAILSFFVRIVDSRVEALPISRCFRRRFEGNFRLEHPDK